MPIPLIRVFGKKIEKKRDNPTFLYDNVNLCDECYDSMKALLIEISDSKKKKNIMKLV